MKQFYFYVLLLIGNICIAQSEVTNLKIKSEPVTLDNTETVDVLVRENTGSQKGTVRKVSWPYLTSVLSSNLIPLTGTTAGNPITGDIEFSGSRNLKCSVGSLLSKINISNNTLGLTVLNGSMYSGLYMFPESLHQTVYSSAGYTTFTMVGNGFSVSSNDSSIGSGGTLQINSDGVSFGSNNIISRGLMGIQDFTANITDLDFTQKKYVDTALQSGLSTRISNGGNSWGMPIVMGSNDAQSVSLKFNNSNVFSITSTNTLTIPNGGVLGNSASGTRGNLVMSTSTEGVSIRRNSSDAGPAFVAMNQNSASTGNIASFSSNIGGTIIVRSGITKSGNLHFPASSNGIVLTSPDGTKYLVTVSNGGTLQSTAITTP